MLQLVSYLQVNLYWRSTPEKLPNSPDYTVNIVVIGQKYFRCSRRCQRALSLDRNPVWHDYHSGGVEFQLGIGYRLRATA